jgi:hypothetical protein
MEKDKIMLTNLGQMTQKKKSRPTGTGTASFQRRIRDFALTQRTTKTKMEK